MVEKNPLTDALYRARYLRHKKPWEIKVLAKKGYAK